MLRYVSPIIPVLDLMIGQVVWAKGGDRGAYVPVHSQLTQSSNPVEVAKSIFNQTGCDCLYLANIDSFAGATPISAVYRELTEAGFSLWIDADWISSLHSDDRVDQILDLSQSPDIQLVFSTETLSSWDEFSIIEGLVNSGLRPIFSLDLRDGKVIAKSEELATTSPLEMVSRAWAAGVRDMIVLDLRSVGTSSGATTEELIREIVQELPDVRIVSGGGVRDGDDAQKLLTAGCQNVLVATAIHECRFTPDDVANLVPYKPCAATSFAFRGGTPLEKSTGTGANIV